jgi:hypothetical protein
MEQARCRGHHGLIQHEQVHAPCQRDDKATMKYISYALLTFLGC